MKILTFDIEEWYLEKFFNGNNSQKYDDYDKTLNDILDLLDEHSTKATFFCLGSMATFFPNIVKLIYKRGHEIGCHSNIHKWVNKMTPNEFLKDTIDAISKLEDLIGNKIVSYRAPAFSIGENTKWAFEILAECGIKNDASVFPGVRDFGGFPTFPEKFHPSQIIYHDHIINEFPITMWKLPIIRKEIAYSGGGYFRLFPINIVKLIMNKSNYVMCYFHISDLLNSTSKLMTRKEYENYFKESGTFSKRFLRYIKSNLGKKKTFRGLEILLNTYSFDNIINTVNKSNEFKLINI